MPTPGGRRGSGGARYCDASCNSSALGGYATMDHASSQPGVTKGAGDASGTNARVSATRGNGPSTVDDDASTDSRS